MASFYLQDLHIRQIIQNAFLNISKEVVTKIPTRYDRVTKLYTSSTFSNVIVNYLLSARYDRIIKLCTSSSFYSQLLISDAYLPLYIGASVADVLVRSARP